MAEAFGLAVNILTVLEYGRQFTVSAWKIWESGPEAINGIATLQLTSKNIRAAAQELREIRSTIATDDNNNERTLELLQRCERVAQKMLQTLDGLVAPLGKRRKKRDAAMAAFKVRWSNNDIKAFQAEMDELRSQITMNLVISLRYSHSPQEPGVTI
jgi:arginyl-tRNA synthetase